MDLQDFSKELDVLAKAESTVDFPSADLPMDIWEPVGDSYQIRPELKAKILDALAQYQELDLVGIADRIHIVGSIGTNIYDEAADIDIHINPKAGSFAEDVDLEELQRSVMNWFKNERDEKDWYVLAHPFEVYLQLDPMQDFYSDTIYDLLTDTWLKPPKRYSMDYNPYQVLGSAVTTLDELLAPVDSAFGKLERLVQDIKALEAAASKHSTELIEKQKLEKTAQVVAILEDLQTHKESWRELRRRNTAVSNGETDPTKLAHSDAWNADNLLFKFIDRYGYMQKVAALHGLLGETGELSTEDALTIPDIIHNS